MTALVPVKPATVAAATDHAHALMRRKGRTFWLASRLLPRALRDDVVVLYAFCRVVDDAVDEAGSFDEARDAAARLARELEGNSPRPEVAAFRTLAARRGIDVRYARELVLGVASDVGVVRIADDAGLVRYAYLVAGTVGAMMERLLGANDPRAHAAAVDLGIAMQLTNICRDVLEDTHRDRVYLPASQLRGVGLDAETLVRGDVDGGRLGVVVRTVLDLADQHYRSARAGYAFLPWRARAAVAVAARLYRQIGVRLVERQGADPMRGRVIVPLLEKARLTLAELSRLFLRARAVNIGGSQHAATE